MKFKDMILILALLIGQLGAMEPEKEELEQSIKELPEGLRQSILSAQIDQLLEAPFPEKPNIDFAKNYLSLIAQFPEDKKGYLNAFAKKWYLTYTEELTFPHFSEWIKRHFPDQTPEQVLDYGVSIAELLKARGAPPIVEGSLWLIGLRINNLDGLLQIPNIREVHTLNLSKNKISVIPNNAFRGLNKLLFLDLYDNQIKTIDPNAFRGLNSLQILSLYNNKIEVIPTTLSGLNNLLQLNLLFNPLSEKTKKWLQAQFGYKVQFSGKK